MPPRSRTVAVAVDVDVPSAAIEGGSSATETPAAGPGTWVSVAVPDGGWLSVVSVAVIVDWPAVVVEVIVA